MKWYWWVLWIFVAWFIIVSPKAAAHAVSHIGHGVSNAAHSTATFLTSVTS